MMNKTEKLYDVLENGNHIMTETASNIATELYSSIWTIRDACYKKRVIFGKYLIKKHEDGKWNRDESD